MAASSSADVRLPAIFGDHMVLQQNLPLHFWGDADPGESVTVAIAAAHQSCTADAGGHWQLDLPAMPASNTTCTVTISGKNTVSFADVLIGDVWLCSGQSNMEFPLGRASNAEAAVPAADHSDVRLFKVDLRISFEPLNDCGGHWEVCTPRSAEAFSAVGYFFADALRQAGHKPIGLIGSYWGGTPIESWISLDGYGSKPPLKDTADWFGRIKADLPRRQSLHDRWYQAAQAAGPAFDAAVQQWKAQRHELAGWGRSMPRSPTGASEPPDPETPYNPTVVYNAMIAPILRYGIKGVIWYQGESNAGGASTYRQKLSALIADWRGRWHQGDFPFLVVQIANYQPANSKPGLCAWAFLREAQFQTTQLVPQTALVVTVDIGASHDIHPRNKIDVGQRLALAARRLTDGETNVLTSGPLFKSIDVQDSQLKITFSSTGRGLAFKRSATSQKADTAPASPGLEIAGPDRRFFPADATIEAADTLLLRSNDVPHPVAARYAWADDPAASLVNTDGLPAVPFRTDDWNDH